MPYVTSWERIARAEGLLDGLAVALELKFGAAGVALLPELQQITDPEVLRQGAERIKTAASVDDLRQGFKTSGHGRPPRQKKPARGGRGRRLAFFFPPRRAPPP